MARRQRPWRRAVSGTSGCYNVALVAACVSANDKEDRSSVQTIVSINANGLFHWRGGEIACLSHDLLLFVGESCINASHSRRRPYDFTSGPLLSFWLLAGGLLAAGFLGGDGLQSLTNSLKGAASFLGGGGLESLINSWKGNLFAFINSRKGSLFAFLVGEFMFELLKFYQQKIRQLEEDLARKDDISADKEARLSNKQVQTLTNGQLILDEQLRDCLSCPARSPGPNDRCL